MLPKQDPFKEHEEIKSRYVLYTKPPHEKKLADRLSFSGWTAYCPLKKALKQWSDRKKLIEEAVFTGLLFIQCRDHDGNHFFQNASTVRYLHSSRRSTELRAEELQSIRHWMSEVNHQSNNINGLPVRSNV